MPPPLQRGELECRDAQLFEKSTGRRIFIRGVNVPAKLPPFRHNLSPDDLERLQSYGFTAVRLVVVWEALEPREGEYDRAYMQSIRHTVRLCAKYGIAVIIDPHQDSWSRWTGGDGAPRWTLERLGFRLDALEACCAAVNDFKDATHPLLWSTNYHLFAAATMFTLFFGSERFAPLVRIDDAAAGGISSVQKWLQSHFIDAYGELASTLKDEPNVLGFGTMNEPSLGWIGLKDLRQNSSPFRFGYGLSPLQCIQLAHGQALWGIVFYGYPFLPTGIRTLNAEGTRAMDTEIWSVNIPSDHFALRANEDPETVFLLPFWDAFSQRIRKRGGEDLHIFTEPLPMENLHYNTQKTRARPAYEIRSPHYYDFLTVGLQRFWTWIGLDFSTGWPSFRSDCRHNTVAMLHATAITEVGMCWLGDAKETDAALEATLAAVESNLTPAVFLWCYVPNHKGDSDGWHRENFSIYANNRLRIPSAVRPYALRVAGRPLRMGMHQGGWVLEFEDDQDGATKTNETLIYTPYTLSTPTITLSDGTLQFDSPHIMRYIHTFTLGSAVHAVKIWI